MCYMSMGAPESVAFGVFKGSRHSPITYAEFSRFRRLVVVRAGYDSAGFSSHSFRCGGATWAFKQGVPEHLIKVQGDWALEAFRSYLDISEDLHLSVFHAMVVCNK